MIIAKRIKVETYLFLKTWMKYSKKGEISDLEILFLLSLSQDGKKLPIPFPQSYRNDYKKGSYNYEQEKIYWNKLLHLVYAQGDENKKIFQDKLMLKKGKEEEEEEIMTLEDHLAFKKTLLLYDWIKGSKEIKAIEEEYDLYRGAIQRLGEGFSWLANSLAAIAESVSWKKKREEDLNKIKILSKRLIEGIEEEGLNLAQIYIPGLNRYYIRKLLREGYSDEKCLKGLSEEKLVKVLPKRLVKRIQKRIQEEEKDNQEVKNRKLIAKDQKLITCHPKLETENRKLKTENCQLETENRPLKTILQIDQHRPDRIIFKGKETKVTARGFSLLYLLAQHKKEVVSYNNILDVIWKDDEDAIYNRVSFHISKIRRTILKTIGESKIRKEKAKNIFIVVPKRGIMLKLKAEEIKTK